MKLKVKRIMTAVTLFSAVHCSMAGVSFNDIIGKGPADFLGDYCSTGKYVDSINTNNINSRLSTIDCCQHGAYVKAIYGHEHFDVLNFKLRVQDKFGIRVKSNSDSNTYGLLIGYDTFKKLSDNSNIRLGCAFGYSRTDYDNKLNFLLDNGDFDDSKTTHIGCKRCSKIDNFSLLGYVGYDKIHENSMTTKLNSVFGLSFGDIKVNSNLNMRFGDEMTIKWKDKGNNFRFCANFDAIHQMIDLGGMKCGPWANLQFDAFHSKKHTVFNNAVSESASLKIDQGSLNIIQCECILGLAGEKVWQSAKPCSSVKLLTKIGAKFNSFNTGDKSSFDVLVCDGESRTPISFTYDEKYNSRGDSSFVANVMLDWKINDKFDMNVGYFFLCADEYQSHTASIGAAYSF